MMITGVILGEATAFGLLPLIGAPIAQTQEFSNFYSQ
jgi:hypothetical protein